MLDAKLIVVGGDSAATEYALELPTIIGRGREADIVIAHPLVSRRHCQLYEENGELMVRDLESLNGTFVGREPVDQRRLRPGELLTVGTVTFRAVYNDWVEDEEDDLELVHDSGDSGDSEILSGLDETRPLNDDRTLIQHKDLHCKDTATGSADVTSAQHSAHTPTR